MANLLRFWMITFLSGLVKQQIVAVDLEKTKSSNDCNFPLGIGDGRIADSQLTSPSFVSTLYIAKEDIYVNAKAKYGRLNDKYAFCGGRFSYLQVNLGQVVYMTAVATQGLDDWAPSYVETYRLRFSLNGQDWFNYSTPNKVWRGNVNGHGIQRNDLIFSIQTQYLRIYPLRYIYERCLRVEVYGCKSSDPGQSESTSTTPRLTTSVYDVKVSPVKTAPADDEKLATVKVLSVVNHGNSTVPNEIVDRANVTLLLGFFIGCFVLVTLTILVFVLFKCNTVKNSGASYRIVKKELV